MTSKPRESDFNIDGPVTQEEIEQALRGLAIRIVRDARRSHYQAALDQWKYDNNLTGR